MSHSVSNQSGWKQSDSSIATVINNFSNYATSSSFLSFTFLSPLQSAFLFSLSTAGHSSIHAYYTVHVAHCAQLRAFLS